MDDFFAGGGGGLKNYSFNHNGWTPLSLILSLSLSLSFSHILSFKLELNQSVSFDNHLEIVDFDLKQKKIPCLANFF